MSQRPLQPLHQPPSFTEESQDAVAAIGQAARASRKIDRDRVINSLPSSPQTPQPAQAAPVPKYARPLVAALNVPNCLGHCGCCSVASCVPLLSLTV